jgi:putative glycosyltransferase (TIGR04348 family)
MLPPIMKPILCLVTPALASANNGNWQTARRWARFLAADYRVRLCAAWDGTPADAMLALHARRSAPSIHAYAQAHPRRPLVVALTGTDLYRDIAVDADAQCSLALAWRLIVLHERAPLDLPAPLRAKAVVCFQSTPARAPLAKTDRHLRALMVGHLRDEKWPQTLWAAAARLQHRRDIRIDHIGAALDADLGAASQACAAAHPAYRWLGGRPHAETLRRIRQAHVLVHTSRMEGGAHVVLEAVRRGTPVLASRIPGNVGMLGEGYGGYFAPGDDAALATLLQRARDEPAMLKALAAQCDTRAPLFDPARERRILRETLQVTLRQALEHPP